VFALKRWGPHDGGLLPPAQVTKKSVRDGSGTPGGMGAISPLPPCSMADAWRGLRQRCPRPPLRALRAPRHRLSPASIYAGARCSPLMASKVIEFNLRVSGDPECQTLMPLLGGELGRCCWPAPAASLPRRQAAGRGGGLALPAVVARAAG